MNRKLKSLVIAGALIGSVGLSASACESAADTANTNLSKACENFECPRRITGINTITDTVIFEVTGMCSYETEGGSIQAVCLYDRATNDVRRTTLTKADNVTVLVTQTGPATADLFRPRVIFRPEGIIPNFDLSTRNNPTEP